jgi:hypothetical protein
LGPVAAEEVFVLEDDGSPKPKVGADDGATGLDAPNEPKPAESAGLADEEANGFGNEGVAGALKLNGFGNDGADDPFDTC